MKLHPDDCGRIAALAVLAFAIAAFHVIRAYWPKDQRAPEPPQIARELRPAERYVLGEPMDVNIAGEDELELLPSVGPKLAARIVAARPFASIDDLARVKGVGPKMLARLRAEVTFTPGPTSPSGSLAGRAP